MVMERMYQSLRNLVDTHSDIPLSIKLSVLNDVCLGLRYLHTRDPPIVHRDLTPNNILLSRDLDAKITDLGVAKVMESTDTSRMTPRPGTLDFMPPECFAIKSKYSTPVDVFSYGGVILYTAIQQWPSPETWVKFDKDTGNKIQLSELERRKHYIDQMAGGSTAELKPLVESCLDDDPSKRPSMTKVSEKIKELRAAHDQARSNEMRPNMWWASGEQQLQLQGQQQQLVSHHSLLVCTSPICHTTRPVY